MRLPVLPLRSWLPLIAATLVSLAPVRSLAQADAGTGVPCALPSPRTALPRADARGRRRPRRPLPPRRPRGGGGRRRPHRRDPRRGQPPGRGRGRPRARSRPSEGQPFDPTRTADDLRALWALGYFSDVQLLVQRLPRAASPTWCASSERPAVREVKLAGNEELTEDDFKDTIDIKPFSILDLDAIQREREEDPGEVRREGLLPRRGDAPS